MGSLLGVCGEYYGQAYRRLYVKYYDRLIGTYVRRVNGSVRRVYT
jgi:hypothetical protein